MNFHGIERDSMLNGEGLRVVLWVSGCNHHCKGCHNPQTWDVNSGFKFTQGTLEELIEEVDKDYIQGLTVSGGDPLHPNNKSESLRICMFIKKALPKKDIWLYTGYSWEEIKHLEGLKYVDVLVDGKFVQELADVNYPWAGSTNQRVIDVKKSLEQGEVVLWRSND